MIKRLKLTTGQFIMLGYIAVILLGTLLLLLPFATNSGEKTTFLGAFFTATSATCVTGLVQYDTYIHWTLFGQIVILMLIQTGGLGFMTIATLILIAMGKKIGVYNQKILTQSFGSFHSSGGTKVIRNILFWTLGCELIGFILLSISFCPKMGVGYGLFAALFHSISAFCNAGFDLMGYFGTPFASLTPFASDTLVNLTIMGLIILGGLGFIVWNDIAQNKWRFRHYGLHARVVIFSTLILIIFPALFFFLTERTTDMFAGMSGGEILLACLFQSVTLRTAGFNTIDVGSLSNSGALLSIGLMLIGGNSGSTAGGIKITTFMVLLFSALSVARNQSDITIGKRRMNTEIMKQAATIFTAYILLIFVGVLIICADQPQLDFISVLFECTSAIATVGLSMGITQQLNIGAQLIIIFLMYIGRVGFITILLSFAEKRRKPPIKYPSEDVLIG